MQIIRAWIHLTSTTEWLTAKTFILSWFVEYHLEARKDPSLAVYKFLWKSLLRSHKNVYIAICLPSHFPSRILTLSSLSAFFSPVSRSHSCTFEVEHSQRGEINGIWKNMFAIRSTSDSWPCTIFQGHFRSFPVFCVHISKSGFDEWSQVLRGTAISLHNSDPADVIIHP